MSSCFARSMSSRRALAMKTEIGNSNDAVSTSDHDHQDRTAESTDQLGDEPDVNNHHSIPREAFDG
ncbi:hypothetical protein PanWU01x14_232820 [Parasponia andersonii]|uniref:Uncharacterized protein n=1 Tax=Parasponia andersonii TaxID=3476 RepID=A0A2P5BJS1_PARAD|nr:hypothetical protein PanWU01x14_232820 [Parasponia andersonii]